MSESFGYVTLDAVRDFMADDTVTEGLGVLNFTDTEIMKALVSAARDFNSIPPRATFVDPNRMPANTNMFFDAVAYQLYRAEHARLAREDVDFEAGNVQVNPAKLRMANLEKLMKTHDDRFREPAKSYKIDVNMRQAYGPVG